MEEGGYVPAGWRGLVTEETSAGCRKSRGLLLWGTCRQGLCRVLLGAPGYRCPRQGPFAIRVTSPRSTACPQASWTGGPMKGQQLTIKVVVSDHIDLFSFSFCPFTVWLESVLILFVSFLIIRNLPFLLHFLWQSVGIQHPGFQPSCRHCGVTRASGSISLLLLHDDQ